MQRVKGMGKPSEMPEFKALLEEWNDKLAKSGFRDIEEFKNGRLELKKSGTVTRFERSDPLTREARARYFEIIGNKIHETTFDSDIDKQIMVLYFEGVTQADIRKRLPVKLHRCTIYKRLYYWLKKWGLK